MEPLLRTLKAIFCLPLLLTALIALPSFVLVGYVLAVPVVPPPLRYAAYLLSAYSVVLTTTALVSALRCIRRGQCPLPWLERVLQHPLGQRLFHDVSFKTQVALFRGLLINLAYVVFKAALGLYYRSAWFFSLAIYYLLLAVLRFFLLRHFRIGAPGQDLPLEYRRYRGYGVILCLMNLALAVVVFFMVWQDRGYEYPGLLIYAMAAYTFYAVILAVVHMVRYRRYGSPVLSAAKAIDLTTALVSLLTLETAMLSQFGGDSPGFRRFMTALTGSGVCITVLGMAVWMLLRAHRQLKQPPEPPKTPYLL